MIYDQRLFKPADAKKPAAETEKAEKPAEEVKSP